MPWMTGAADLDGNNRIIRGIVDIGAYEYSSTAMRCNFTAAICEGWPPLTVPFTAFVDGTNTSIIDYRWNLDVVSTNILEGPGLAKVTNDYTVADYYTVSLFVSNTAGETSHILKTDYIRAYPTTVYVSHSGSHKRPYTSWATAATNINDAADVAANGTLVLVADGTYLLSSEIQVTDGATVKSVNGAGAVIVDGNDTVRCFYIDHANAVVDGFTITNGVAQQGGGVYIKENGTVQNCVISGNRSWQSGVWSTGAGVYIDNNGTVQSCIISGNSSEGTYSRGAGMYVYNNGTVRDCIFYANTASASYGGYGGGIYVNSSGIFENCLVYANWAKSSGSGIYCNDMGDFRNCTICNNSGQGLYASSAKLYDSILYYNTGENYDSGGTFLYCCSTPKPGGQGNIDNPPDFVNLTSNDYHLTLASPCLEAGTNLPWMAGATDLDGNDRINCEIVDMGAYEYTSADLRCNFIAQGPVKGWPPLSVSFLALVDRTNSPIVSYAWDFDGDGTNDITAPDAVQVSNLYATPGIFTVSLTVSNEAGMTASVSRIEYVVTYPEISYVSPNGGHRKPFDTWSKAATNPVEAVDFAVDGMRVVVTDGVYLLSQSITTTNKIKLESVNGSDSTVLDGRGSVRCIYIDHADAVIDGFTIRNGAASKGAGAYLYYGGMIQNCAFISNSVWASGGGTGGGAYLWGYGTMISNCAFSANSADGTSGGAGGGVYTYRGLVVNCSIKNNFAKYNGGGGATSSDGEFINCIFSGVII